MLIVSIPWELLSPQPSPPLIIDGKQGVDCEKNVVMVLFGHKKSASSKSPTPKASSLVDWKTKDFYKDATYFLVEF